jgi:SAM-dependent methyltransferase
MGVGAKNLIRILDLCSRGVLPPGAGILEFGAQRIRCAGAEESVVAEFHRFFTERRQAGWNAASLSKAEIAALAREGFSASLFRACGFGYQALDIFDGDGVMLFDLNIQEAPRDMIGKFDLVTNFGTTEHLINQLQAMRTIHDFAKPGGLMYHDLPLGGYHTHGYFSYNPMLFQHLAQANSYEILYHAYSRKLFESAAPNFMTRNGYAASGWVDCGIEFVLRKTIDQPFRMPLETGTSLGLNAEVWKGDDPYGRRMGEHTAADATEGHLQNITGRELQKELWSRYRRRLLRLIGFSRRT